MERYRCTKPLNLPKYDDDGSRIENSCTIIETGEIWEVVKRKYNIVASNNAIRLKKDQRWIEIHQGTLDHHFEKALEGQR